MLNIELDVKIHLSTASNINKIIKYLPASDLRYSIFSSVKPSWGSSGISEIQFCANPQKIAEFAVLQTPSSHTM